MTNPDANDSLALRAHGVSKRFGDRQALDGVDLTARYGEVHGLLGPNGAGKTTLLRVVLGLIRRDAGSLDLLGRRVEFVGGGVPAAVGGFVETPSFYPYLSARTNLAALARLDGDPSGLTVRDLLGEVGLAAAADQPVGGYSAGMRQRLGIAAALLRRPRLLLLDEPTSSLDPAGARDVTALIRRLAEEGVAIVFSSHDMIEVEALCAALTVIDHGRVVFSGTSAEMRAATSAPMHVLRTSDEARALALARGRAGADVTLAPDGGLEVRADQAWLDAYVIALGQNGVAVRSLQRVDPTLESLFLQLTTAGKGATT